MKKRETYLLMDVAIPNDSNINIKETEKLSKYKDLQVEVSRLCSEHKNCASYNWSIRNN